MEGTSVIRGDKEGFEATTGEEGRRDWNQEGRMKVYGSSVRG